MVFSSHLFVFYFLPLSLLLYYGAPRRARHLILTLLSYVFYGWANPAFVILMMVSTLIDYAAGLAMSRPPAVRKAALIASVCSNLALLGFFKYFNFAVENYNALAQAVGLGDLRLDEVMRVTLPLGISFYTFQTMSYTIDVYRREAAAQRNFIDFACYVSMFPQLVAGPIVRYREVDDQIRRRTHSFEKFARGVAFFSFGMAKKILLANPCGKVADVVFGAGPASTVDSWFGVLAYAFQIYFDFSGYSDMAIGLGLMFGFVFTKNFDSPYRSASISEFWGRWHISLSTWLRDYLYVPLGGNRRGATRTYVNLALVMLLGGLWHGAAWTFLVWGAIHGAALILERALGKRTLYQALPLALRRALTFAIVLVSWVFFRSTSIGGALSFCGAMLGWAAPSPGTLMLDGILYQPYYLGTVVLAGVIAFAAPQTWDVTRALRAPHLVAVALLLGASLGVLCLQGYNPFIYFIF